MTVSDTAPIHSTAVTDTVNAASNSTSTAVDQRILDAAREEFIAHGFQRTSVPQIARRAHMSRQTVYRYFSSKAAIIQGVVTRETIGFFSSAREAMADLDTAESRLVETFVLGMRESRTNPLMVAAMTFEPETLVGLLYGSVDESDAAHPDPLETGAAAAAAVVAGPDLDFDAAQRVGVLAVRLTFTMLLKPTPTFVLETDEQTRAFAASYLAPLIDAARRATC